MGCVCSNLARSEVLLLRQKRFLRFVVGQRCLKATAMHQDVLIILLVIVKIVMCTYAHHNTQQSHTYTHIQIRAHTHMCIRISHTTHNLLNHAPRCGFACPYVRHDSY